MTAKRLTWQQQTTVKCPTTTVKHLTRQQQTALQSHKPNESLHPKAMANAKATAQAKVKANAKGTAEAKAKLSLRIAQQASLLRRVRKRRGLAALMITIVLSSSRFDWLMWRLRRRSPHCLTTMPGKDGSMIFLILEPGCILS
jgi:hypothetical protein